MNRAFTLLELLLTMTLLSITALLFITYTGDVGTVSVDGLSRKIQSDVRLAQQLATSTGTPHGVQFTQGGNYVVYVNNTATPATDPLTRMPMIKNPLDFGDVVLSNSYQVQFDKVGKPTIGGGGNVMITADSGASRVIYVIANTGAVVFDPPQYGGGCGCRMCGKVMR